MNSKARIRAGFVFGISMSLFYILWNYLSHPSGGWTRPLVSGLLSGVIAGILFGWLMGLFAGSKMVNEATKIETDPGETIEWVSPANHFKGREGVGGKLYLTNERLVFKSHKLNFQNHQWSVSLTMIQKVERFKTLHLFNTGLGITNANGKVDKFVVNEPAKWISLINGKIARS